MKAPLCDNCNSQITIIKKNNGFVVECSYCGNPSDIEVGVDFAEDYEVEDEE